MCGFVLVAMNKIQFQQAEGLRKAIYTVRKKERKTWSGRNTIM